MSRHRHRKSAVRLTGRPRTGLSLRQLEDRNLPSCDGFQALALYLNQADNALSGVTTALSSLVDGASVDLPILGQSLKDMPEAEGIQGPDNFLQELRNDLISVLSTVTDADAARTQLFAALGPNGIDILGDTNHSGGANPTPADIQPDDIVIITDPNAPDNFTFSIRLTKTFTVADVNFNLGLPSIPMFPDVAADGNVVVAVTLDYDQFTLKVQDCVPHFETLNPTTNQDSTFKISVAATIPGTQVTGRLGFLQLSATDKPDRDNGETTNFTGVFTMTVDPNQFLKDLRLSGAATVSLGIDAGFDGNGLSSYAPSFSADFYMHWAFSNEDQLGTLDEDFGEDELQAEFRDVTMQLGTFLTDLVGPGIGMIQFLSEPVAPLFELLDSPLPVLTDLADLPVADVLDHNSDGDVTVLDLAHLAIALHLIPPPYDTIVEVFVPLVELTNFANAIENYDTNAEINFGDFELAGDGNKDLRDPALDASNSADPLAKDWSNVFAASIGGLDLTQEKQIISNTFNDLAAAVGEPAIAGIGAEIVQKIDDAQKVAYNGYHLDFPVFTNPGLLANLLLGHDADLFSFAAQAYIPQASIPIAEIPVGPAHIDLDATFMHDGFFRVGYDTFGLRKALSLSDPLHLGDGFYLDANTHFVIQAGASASFSANFEIFEPYVKGQLTADISITVDGQPNVDLDGDTEKLRFTDAFPPGEFGECVLETAGGIDGAIVIGVKIGVEVLGEFIGVDFNTTLAEGEIINLDSGCITPWDHDVVLAGQEDVTVFKDAQDHNAFHLDPALNPNGILTLNVGPNAQYRFFKSDPNDPEYVVNEQIGVVHADPISGDLPGEAVYVSAFGMVQRYDGVKKIVVVGGTGNDSISIGEDIGVPATLHGDDPNDPQATGDDHLSYLGTASANLFGEDGDDVLVGGAGINALAGGAGDDEITGGSGKNTIDGGGGKDTLTAGPMGDWLDGGSGDDHFIAGAGNDTMVGGPDDDTFTWVSGNGSTTIDGGGGKNSLGMAGSDEDETYVVTKTASPDNRLKVQAPNNKTVLAKNIAKLGLDCLGGSDFITVQPLTGIRIEQVGINLSDNLQPDNAADTIIVNGTPDPDQMTVEAVQVGIQSISSDDPRIPPTFVMGGVMKISGLPHYDVYAMNFADDLTVNGKNGADTIDVKSITGTTHISGSAANDTINVYASASGQYLTSLDVDAGSGSNALQVNEGWSLTKDKFLVTKQTISSGFLPGVKYKASGGNYGGGIKVVATNWDDDVNIVSTLAGVTTTVNAMGGNDTVRVSSSAPAKFGDLLGIGGTLTLDLGAGSNALQISDQAAPVGNQNVDVTSTHITGFAGPGDATAVNYKATGGALMLTLDGSNSLNETFKLDNPGATVRVNGNGGNDKINVRALSKPAIADGGVGNDTIKVGYALNSLDLILASLTVAGGGGVDTVNVADQSAASGKTYPLSANTLTRGGATIQFDSSLESLNLATTNLFNDTINVTGVPAGTAVNIKTGGGAGDILAGPAGANTWQITQQNAGVLDGTIKFIGVEYLTGGAGKDSFVFAKGIGVSGTVAGQGGIDTLDYSAYVTPVTINLQTQQSTGIGGFSGIDRVIGGHAFDKIVGRNADNVWQILNHNAGEVANINSSVAFSAIENLLGGTNGDRFQFHMIAGPAPQVAQISGIISGLGGVNSLDYGLISVPVIVSLQAGTATGVAGNVNGIANVVGGLREDILIGDQFANMLSGGAGFDLLIGRGGIDILIGDQDDDILIGASTQYDGNILELLKVLQEWSSGASYDDRIAHLTAGGGPYGNILLTPVTVTDDMIGDILTGSAGTDFFWARLPVDTITDLLSPPERVGTW